MSDATRRGLRTGLQLLLTLLTTGGLQAVLGLFGRQLTAEQYAAVTGVALPFVTALVNELEDRGTVPAVLKAPASDGADHVPSGDLEVDDELEAPDGA